MTIQFATNDVTVPWDSINHVGWIELNSVPGVSAEEAATIPWEQLRAQVTVNETPWPTKLCLMPVPQGRLLSTEAPCRDLPRGTATPSLTFTDLEPGLYAAQYHDGNYQSFYYLRGTSGFLYLPPNGSAITSAVAGDSTPLSFVFNECAWQVRIALVQQRAIDPRTGEPVTDLCGTKSDPNAAGGTSGNGTQ
jgi:hypothetical protein